MINLYIIDYYPSNIKTGLRTYINELCNSLKDREDILLHNIWVDSKKHSKIEVSEEKNGASNIYIPEDISLINKVTVRDQEIAEFLAARMNKQVNTIVHFHWINHTPFAWLLKQRTSCKILLTKHCIPYRELMLTNYRAFRKFNKQAIGKGDTDHLHPMLKREKLGYEQMDHIICVSKFAKDSLYNLLKIDPNKISVVYNGLDSDGNEVRNSNALQLKEKYGFARKEKIILVAGRICKSKGVFDLCQAFELLLEHNNSLNVRLVFAGQGDHTGLISHTKKHWARITITGGLDKKTLNDFYTMADIGLVPSYIEQCSYTAIEMMHNGLPVIVSNVDGLKEIVPEDCGLKTNLLLGRKNAKLDIHDLAMKLKLLLEQPKMAKEFGKNARKYALNNLTANRMIAETLSIYKGMLKVDISGTSDTRNSIEPEQSLVTVILPCFNGEAFLKECVSSILNQTYQRFELIIVDDASTDNSGSIIQSFPDPRIKYIRHEQNIGIAKSLNLATGMAKGKYIARIDADDCVDKGRLGKQVAYLEQNRDVALVGSVSFVMDRFSRLIDIFDYPELDKDIRVLLFFKAPFCRATTMVRAEVVKRIKYSTKYKYSEDYHFWFRVASKYKVGNLQEGLTACRIHGQNASMVHKKLQQSSTLELISDELDKLGIEHSPEELALHAAICFGHGTSYFNTSKRIEDLKAWISKVVIAYKTRCAYPVSPVKYATNYILSRWCGIQNIK
jgi:glycosyltransferase involved in cell wall biosynthesis